MSDETKQQKAEIAVQSPVIGVPRKPAKQVVVFHIRTSDGSVTHDESALLDKSATVRLVKPFVCDDDKGEQQHVLVNITKDVEDAKGEKKTQTLVRDRLITRPVQRGDFATRSPKLSTFEGRLEVSYAKRKLDHHPFHQWVITAMTWTPPKDAKGKKRARGEEGAKESNKKPKTEAVTPPATE